MADRDVLEMKLLVVTPAQLGEGYLIQRGPFIERRGFTVIHRLADGNAVVIDPSGEAAARAVRG
jgi:ABC-type ATPase with predicted acetyltransferase domain